MTAGQNYSFLDLSVHPDISPWVMSTEATVVFSADLRNIHWANALGARLFGGRGVVELLDANLSDEQTFIRQLRDAIKQMTDDTPIIRGFRVNQGLRSALFQFEISPIRFTDGNLSYRVVQKTATQPERLAEHETAQLVVESLEGFADAAAILDDYGLPLATTRSFARLGPSEQDLASVVQELTQEEDRLIKRPLQSAIGGQVLAGLGRISTNPGRNLLVLADTMETENNTVQPMVLNENVATQDDEDGNTHLMVGNTDADSQDATPNPEDTLVDDRDSDSADQATGQSDDTVSNETIALADNQQQTLDEDAAIEALNEYDPTPSDRALDNSEEETDNHSPVENEDLTEIVEFQFKPQEEPVRFAWTVDENSVFTNVSDELPATIGPQAADVIGRSWHDVSTVFGFDHDKEIANLLNKQDTWSGKTVLWPVQSTDFVVPIDLAALPAFGAERTFEGFRGFGTIRTLDVVVDPEETGLALAANSTNTTKAEDTSANQSVFVDEEVEEAPPVKPTVLWFELDDEVANSTSSEGEPGPNVQFAADDLTEEDTSLDIHRFETDENSNVVHLNSKASARAGDLSKTETEAFEKIGSQLRRTSEQDQEIRNDEPAKPDTSLIENLPVAILISRDGNVLFANELLLETLGFLSIEEINDKGGLEAIIVSTDNQDSTLIARADGETINTQTRMHTVPWDGEKALQLSFAPPSPAEMLEIDAIEITQASEIQSILDTTSDGIVLLTEEGEIISINASAEALFNRSFDDSTGTHFTKLFAAESHGEINQYINALSEPGVASIMQEGKEVLASASHGGEFPVFLTLARLESTEKLCAVIQDLTSWKKTEQDLIQSRRDAERANEQKSDFLAQVSHEIRTPLNAIIGFSDIMIDERFGPVENTRYREYLRDIKKSGQHVLDLVNDLLDLSKIESGKLELTFDAVELNRCVTETVAMLQPQANAKRIIIRTSLSRAVPKVVADQRTIRQIIINLVTNAIKFSRNNSQVIVTTVYESTGEVALRVRDTGKGMTEQEITQALKPYQQVKATHDPSQEGTGLGLPLTKALVEANRAFFDIESEPGDGTIVHVQFPTQRVLTD